MLLCGGAAGSLQVSSSPLQHNEKIVTAIIINFYSRPVALQLYAIKFTSFWQHPAMGHGERFALVALALLVFICFSNTCSNKTILHVCLCLFYPYCSPAICKSYSGSITRH